MYKPLGTKDLTNEPITTTSAVAVKKIVGMGQRDFTRMPLGLQKLAQRERKWVVNFDQMIEYHKTNEEEQQNTTEVRVTNEYYNRVIFTEYAHLFFALFGVLLSIVVNELKFNHSLDEMHENLITMYISFASIACVFTLYYRYQLYLKWNVYRGLLSEFDNLISTGWWPMMALEQGLMLISPYPYL